MPDADKCRDCGVDILWITDGRDRVAINATPIPAVFDLTFKPDDTAIKGYTREGSLVAGRRPREGETAAHELHLTHSRTCTEARAWKGRGRRYG